MRRGKPLNVLVGSLTQTEKETLAGIIQEADIAGQMNQWSCKEKEEMKIKTPRQVFREQGGKCRGKLKRLCSILGKQKTDTKTVLDVFYNEMTRKKPCAIK